MYSGIQQFIQYKIQNKHNSQQQARAFRANKKYQKLLDELHQQVHKKQIEFKAYEYESKKNKKGVWQKLLLISNHIHKLQKQRSKFANHIRQMVQSRENQKKYVQNQIRNIMKNQKLLQTKIKQSQEQFNQQYQQKSIQIIQMNRKSQLLLQRIEQLEPSVLDHRMKTRQQLQSMQKINTIQSQKNRLEQEKEKLHIQQQTLNQRALQAFNIRQKDDDKMTEIKKQQIQAIIHNINNIIKENRETQTENIKIKYQQIKSAYKVAESQQKQRAINQSKLNSIIQKIHGKLGSQSQNKYKMYIDESPAVTMQTNINKLREQINQVQEIQKIQQVKCGKLETQQNSKQKQLNHLTQTIKKISESLSKK